MILKLYCTREEKNRVSTVISNFDDMCPRVQLPKVD
jgi:hypothetical protein